MLPRQTRNNKKSSGTRLALGMILLAGLAVLASYKGAITPTAVRAMPLDELLRLDGKINLIPPVAGLLGLQPSPSPKLPPANSGGGQHFEIFNLDNFEANLKAELQSKTVGYSYAIYENTDLKRAGGGG